MRGQSLFQFSYQTTQVTSDTKDGVRSRTTTTTTTFGTTSAHSTNKSFASAPVSPAPARRFAVRQGPPTEATPPSPGPARRLRHPSQGPPPAEDQRPVYRTPPDSPFQPAFYRTPRSDPNRAKNPNFRLPSKASAARKTEDKWSNSYDGDTEF